MDPARIRGGWLLRKSFPSENEADDLFAVRSIADVPWPGTCFNAGEPVMTLMAAGADLAECRSRMIQLEQAWTERLGIVGGERTMSAFSSRSLASRGRRCS